MANLCTNETETDALIKQVIQQQVSKREEIKNYY